jgi:hypothetical protein
MKRKLIILTTGLIFLSGTVSAIDFIWKDEQGDHYYDCGGHVVGGRARIKPMGDGLYRAQGVRINRLIRADSIYHAAQIACGERPETELPPSATPAE